MCHPLARVAKLTEQVSLGLVTDDQAIERISSILLQEGEFDGHTQEWLARLIAGYCLHRRLNCTPASNFRG
jgi:hypothetical protein